MNVLKVTEMHYPHLDCVACSAVHRLLKSTHDATITITSVADKVALIEMSAARSLVAAFAE